MCIQVSSTSAALGSTVNVSVDATQFTPTAAGTVFWPFVNGTQWGSFVTCAVAGRDASADGGCTILLPLPRAGRVSIEVAVLREGREWGTVSPSVYPVGTPFPSDPSDVLARSTASVGVDVRFRRVTLPAGARGGDGREVCIDWEPWHTQHNAGKWMGRPGASAIPMVGMYVALFSLVQHMRVMLSPSPVVDNFTAFVAQHRKPCIYPLLLML